MKMQLPGLARIKPQSPRPSRIAGRLRTVGAAGAVAGLLLTGLAVPAEAATVYQAPLRTAVRSLPVAAEVNTGYDRDRYFGR